MSALDFPGSELASVNHPWEIEEAGSNVQGRSQDSKDTSCLKSTVFVYNRLSPCWVFFFFFLMSRILSLNLFSLRSRPGYILLVILLAYLKNYFGIISSLCKCHQNYYKELAYPCHAGSPVVKILLHLPSHPVSLCFYYVYIFLWTLWKWALDR